jgi:hypothetical protein
MYNHSYIDWLIDWFVDWLIFNSNYSSMSAIWWVNNLFMLISSTTWPVEITYIHVHFVHAHISPYSLCVRRDAIKTVLCDKRLSVTYVWFSLDRFTILVVNGIKLQESDTFYLCDCIVLLLREKIWVYKLKEKILVYKLREKIWVYKTSLIPSLIIDEPVPSQESERSCKMCGRGIDCPC